MFKKKGDFLFFSKNIYLLITICFPFQSNPPQILYTCASDFSNPRRGLLICAFWYGFELFQRCGLYLFNRGKSPFMDLFSFGNKKKSQGAKSGEYGGMTVLFLAKKSRTSNDVLTGALSWCNIHDWLFHNSGRFFRIVSCKRRITSRLYSLLIVRPCGKNSRCTAPL